MELFLLFTCAGDDTLWRRLQQSRREMMELVSAVVGEKHYGTTLESIGVDVIVQDAGMIGLETHLSRERKEIGIDVELSKRWVKNASDGEIKSAFLQCLIKAIGIAKQRLTRKNDDFDADKLIADLRAVAGKLEREIE